VTLKHKIKLIFSRLNWWLSLTNEAKIYAKKTKEYENIKLTLQEKQKELIHAEKHEQNTEEILIEIRLLNRLLK